MSSLREQFEQILDNMPGDSMVFFEAKENTVDALIQAVEASLPPRYTLQTGLLWDSQDATDGYHEALADMRKELV